MIDAELRLLAAVRWSIREHVVEPSSRQVDELLDERLLNRDADGCEVPSELLNGSSAASSSTVT